jgi:hypothetical protein
VAGFQTFGRGRIWTFANNGAGVYALYYHGDFPEYAPLVQSENPIYVGKSDPADGAARTPRQQGKKLFDRLRRHQKSIREAAANLRSEDFACRYLVVQSGAQVAAEKALINLFQPIWNDEIGICWGIGKHGDSAGTRANKRAPWDTLHAGRPWAGDARLEDAKSVIQIREEIAEHLRANPPFPDLDSVLRHFLEHLKQR